MLDSNRSGAGTAPAPFWDMNDPEACLFMGAFRELREDVGYLLGSVEHLEGLTYWLFHDRKSRIEAEKNKL